MSSFQIQGKLYRKFDTEQKTETFKAREFVLLIEDGAYPQYIKFQLTQERCSLIDPFELNEDLTVHFDLRGREWNDKFFTNLNAWRIEKAQKGEAAPMPDPDFPNYEDAPPASKAPDTGDALDDLPF